VEGRGRRPIEKKKAIWGVLVDFRPKQGYSREEWGKT